ncbi:MAG: cytochrome b/b6 domain-containing protein [Pseudomonadota bacterium]
MSKAVHVTVYGLLLFNPHAGWAGTSAFPAKITVFWLFELPAVVGPNRALSKELLEIQAWSGLASTALVCLHLAAAFYHHVALKDRLPMRMISGCQTGFRWKSLRACHTGAL